MTRLKTISRSIGQSCQAESGLFNGSIIVLVLPLRACDVDLHPIEAFLPGRNVLVYPRFGRLKGVRLDHAGSNASTLLGSDEPTPLKNTHMFEQRWQS